MLAIRSWCLVGGILTASASCHIHSRLLETEDFFGFLLRPSELNGSLSSSSLVSRPVAVRKA